MLGLWADNSSGQVTYLLRIAWRIGANSIVSLPIVRMDAALNTASPSHLIRHAPKVKSCSSPFSTQPTTKKASEAQKS